MDKDVDIFVKPNPDPTGKEKYLFSMDDGKGATEELVFNKTTDGMKKTDHYKVKFKLHNKEGAALRFSKDPLKVLWAKPVNSTTDPCPNSDCYMAGIFYVDPNDSIQDHKLTVINTDPDVQLFKFALNFLPPGESDPPPSGYVWYDPIGSNQNGGFSNTLGGGGSFAMAIGGGIIGAAAAVFTSQTLTTTSLVTWTAIGAVAGYVGALILGNMRGQPA